MIRPATSTLSNCSRSTAIARCLSTATTVTARRAQSLRLSTATSRFIPATRRTYAAEAVSQPPRSKKIYSSADEAVADIKSGSTLLSGGFGLCGTPDTLIQALAKRKDVNNLTGVSNNAGVGDKGLGLLLSSGQISKMIASYIGG